MQISSRFTIAVHMMTCMETFKEDYKITSDFLASSIHVTRSLSAGSCHS